MKLIIISCGKKKTQDFPTRAKNAYTSTYFEINKRYAAMCGNWVIISAKHGFLDPNTVITEDYDATKKFEISVEDMVSQVQIMRLNQFNEIEILGGARYVLKVREVFSKFPDILIKDPLAGKGIGVRMQLTKQATLDGSFSSLNSY